MSNDSKPVFIQIDESTRNRFVHLLANHPHFLETEMGFGGLIDRWVEKEWDALEAEKELLEKTALEG